MRLEQRFPLLHGMAVLDILNLVVGITMLLFNIGHTGDLKFITNLNVAVLCFLENEYVLSNTPCPEAQHQLLLQDPDFFAISVAELCSGTPEANESKAVFGNEGY